MTNHRVHILILIAIILAGWSPPSPAEGQQQQQQQRLLEEKLSKLAAANERGLVNYDIIHKLALADQVKYYQPAQRSLQTRVTKSLDGLYDFCLDESSEGFANGWHSREIQRSCKPENFYRMPVPSAFNEIASNKTVRNYIGWLWYQTVVDHYGQFFAANSPQHHRYIQFESINYLSIVWIQPLNSDDDDDDDDVDLNDSRRATLVASHVGGHLPFIANITQALVGLDGRPFRLTVAVSNNLTDETIPSGRLIDLSEQVGRKFAKLEPDFDFFHFAGILGSISMLQLPKIFIQEVRQIHPSRMRATEEHEQLELRFEIEPNLADARPSDSCRLRYQLELFNGRKRLLDPIVNATECVAPLALTVPLNGWKNLTWRAARGDVNYFAPQLRVRVALAAEQFEGKTFTDSYELPVGLRPDWIDLFGGIQMQGFGMHQEQLFSGRSMGGAAIMKDLYLLKRLGANVIRSSHYPYSVDYLDACRENGMPVIAECPAVGLRSFSASKLKLHKQMLREMVQRDANNPAIIGWSVANEPASQLKPARAYFKELLDYARTNLSDYVYRADKFLTAAIAQSHEQDQIGDLLDVIMINRYFGWYEFTGVLEAIERPLLASIRGWAAKHPRKQLLVSEFGADTLAGFHSTTDELFSEEYQTKLVREHERLFDELFANRTRKREINFIGSMVWNFADFSTDASLLRVGGNKKGLLTQDRRPKLAAHELARIYRSRLGQTSQ